METIKIELHASNCRALGIIGKMRVAIELHFWHLHVTEMLAFVLRFHTFLCLVLRNVSKSVVNKNLIARYFLLVARYFLLVARYILLVAHYFLLGVPYFLCVARYFLLFARYFFLVA